jgi:hypothetical protein
MNEMHPFYLLPRWIFLFVLTGSMVRIVSNDKIESGWSLISIQYASTQPVGCQSFPFTRFHPIHIFTKENDEYPGEEAYNAGKDEVLHDLYIGRQYGD